MLRRLADAGVATDADTNDDFRLTRELPGWPEVASLITAARGGAPVVNTAAAAGKTGRPAAAARANVNATAAAPVPGSSTGAAATVATLKPSRVDDAARFSAGGFVAGGLAYDSVSRRFVVGDASGRKLMVVSERSDHATDMVRADSAGFQDVIAVEIDEKRGDLWVASAATAGGQSALHRLQLVSGRPLRTYRPSGGDAQLVDLAVTASGSVLALDGTGNQLLVLKRGETALESAVQLGHTGALSLTISADEGVGYVASPEGIWRVDIKGKKTAAVTAPAGVDLGHFERIRIYQGGLIGIEKPVDGSRRVVRLDLNNNGRAITAASVIDTSIADARSATFATISGDELYYLAAAVTASASAAGATPGPLADFIVRRVSLR
jgi:hypothetical protein